MQVFISVLIVVMAETALATMIIIRAWQHRPARWFVAFIATMGISSMTSYLRTTTPNSIALTWLNNSSIIAMSGIAITSLGLLSSLFMPVWWQAKKPIRLIMLPYIFFAFVLIVDIIAGLGLVVVPNSGMLATSMYVKPGSIIFLFLYLLGWIFQIGFLSVAFKRYPQWRKVIAMLIASLLISSSRGLIATTTGLHGILSTFIATIPILITLSYAVLGSDLIIPMRAALDQAMLTLHDIVIVLDQSKKAIYANNAAYNVGVRLHQTLTDELIQAGFVSDTVDDANSTRVSLFRGRRYDLEERHVWQKRSSVPSTLVIARDVTDIYERTELLENERATLAATVEQLNAERGERQQLETTVHQLVQPIIPVLQGVLVVPLVGEFDAVRRESFTHSLLAAVKQGGSRCVLIDVTGVSLLDETDAHMLVNIASAIKLSGARCVLIGVRPEISQSLVMLNVPLNNLSVSATLQQAVHAEIVRQT